jgi:hypothetical protein
MTMEELDTLLTAQNPYVQQKKISEKCLQLWARTFKKIRQTSPRPKSLKNIILIRRQIISLSGADTLLGLALPSYGRIDNGLRWKPPSLNTLQ